MSTELTALIAAVLVQCLAIFVAQGQMNRELGAKANAGPRDVMPEMSPLLGRLRRAVNNGFEGLALFAPVVLTVEIAALTNSVTAISAWVYVAARIAYLPAYAYGLSPWRSLIWAFGFFATMVLALTALIAGLAA